MAKLYPGETLQAIKPFDKFIFDRWGKIIGVVNTNANGKDFRPSGVYLKSVAVSRDITPDDFEEVLHCTAALTLTVPNDATLNMNTDSSYSPSIAFYQTTAGALMVSAGSGVTINGSAPTAAQFLTSAIRWVGPNEWSWFGS